MNTVLTVLIYIIVCIASMTIGYKLGSEQAAGNAVRDFVMTAMIIKPDLGRDMMQFCKAIQNGIKVDMDDDSSESDSSKVNWNDSGRVDTDD